MDDEGAAAGRGRGRGRGRGGGVSILPAGMWESMRGDADDAAEAPPSPPQQQPQQQQQQQQQPPQQPTRHDDGQFDDADFAHGKGRGRNKRADDGEGRGKPIFKKGDWECPSCMNVNWGWRTHCNVCNTAKSGASDPDGVRDGIGGGFNERQERVAAATSVEVAEDGFDDFGRRSKANKSDRTKREEAALKRQQMAYGFLLDPASIAAPPSFGVASPSGKDTNGLDIDSRKKDAAKEFGFFKEARKNEADQSKQNEKGRADKHNQRRRDRSNSRDRRGGGRANDDRDRRNRSRDRDRRSRSRSHDRYRREGRGRDRSRDRPYR